MPETSIQHPKCGLGFVVGVTPQAIQVVFEDGERSLVHNPVKTPLRILTMNMWHGLSPTNVIAFERLEPTPRLRIRERLQVRLLEETSPDIAFFQEVNPVSLRSVALADAFGAVSCFQPDLSGIKLFGFGLPLHLFSGLVIGVRRPRPLKRLAGVKLSGQGRSFVLSWASVQLKEERFALFAETRVPKLGRMLLINTHLHHGLEAMESFIETMAHVTDELKLSSSAKSEIRSRLFAGNERRSREMSVLLRELEDLRSAFVILGGDFNCEPDGEIGQRLRDLGFIDVWRKVHPKEPGYTFDREKNIANHILQDDFPPTFMVEDLSFSDKTKEALHRLLREQERRPRRIDQLWIKASTGQIRSMQAQLVGFPDASGIAPSDHFGLMADIEFES